MNRFFTAVIIFILLTMSAAALPVSAEEIHSIDLSGLPETKDFYETLNGEWTFFHKQLLSPGEAKRSMAAGGKTVHIPASFQETAGEVSSFGTYSAIIKIPERFVGETLAVFIPYQYSAYILFADHNELARNGQIGTAKETHQAEMAPRIGYFIAQSDEIQLTMQLSSFQHIRGGFENNIFIGEAAVVSEKFSVQIAMSLFINGCIFIIGLFMLSFALYRRQEQQALVFGLFCMLISARAIFTDPFYYTLLLADLSWVWGTRLEYILTEASSWLYVVLLWQWHKEIFSKKVLIFLSVVHGSLIAITLCTQPAVFQAVFFTVFYLAIPTFFYFIYVFYKGIRSSNPNAIANAVGIVIIFFAFLNDFAIANNWYQSFTLMLPAVACYVFVQVFVMSRNFASVLHETEQLNTELMAANSANERLVVRLQEEANRKDDFLANTSHELRNPLHGIINITQSVLRAESKKNNEKTVSDLTLVLTIGHYMSRTIDDLLDITRLKEQRIQLRQEVLDIQSIALGVTDMFEVLLENKDIRLQVDIPPDLPRVYADRMRIIQILFNLLHNAVKFTQKGMITISADEQDGWIAIEITDTGIGMEDEVLQKIFEPYEQAESSDTSAGGIGLGLTICRQLAELHGGVLHASSVAGEGSVFTFTLPIAETAERNPGGQAAAVKEEDIVFDKELLGLNTAIAAGLPASAAAHKPKILAVDDDPVNLKVIKSILPQDRYEVETVATAKEALRRLPLKEWDLVISDVMLPVMSGYELTRAIRESRSISELPILLLTARSLPEDIYTGFIAGANDYVTKPVDAVEMNVRVQALTNLKASVAERLSMEAAWLQAQIRPHFLFNTLNTIVSLSEIDQARMVKLLETFSVYLRSSFDMRNVDQVIPLKKELELVKSYIYIEQERFGSRLQMNYAIESDDQLHIPPLSIQTLIENAVNHGVLKRIEGGTVTLAVRKQEEGTLISISDDGVGMSEETIKKIWTVEQDEKKGIGMRNTDRRLKQLYGEGLKIQSEAGKGTTISFIVK